MKPISQARRDGTRYLLGYEDRWVTGRWVKGSARRRRDGVVHYDTSGEGFWLPDDAITTGYLRAFFRPPISFAPIPDLPSEELIEVDEQFERGVAAGGG